MASVETGVEHRGRDKRRARGRRKIRRIFGEKSAIFAASPLLLLVVGFLSRFQPTVLQARAEIIDDNNDGAGGRFGYWRTSGRVDSTGGESSQQYRQRRLQTTLSFGVVLSESTVSVAEGGTDATYTVKLDADPTTPIKVDIANGGSSDASVSTALLTFTTADWDDEQTVTVTAVEDGGVESVEEVIITHSVDIDDTDFVWGGSFSPSADLLARVYDNDEAGILVSSSSLYVDEGSIATYTVELMGSPSQNVEVTATASGTYITVSTSMPLTFTSGSWDTAQTITITGEDDALQTAEYYTGSISHTASSADALFDGDAVVFFPSTEISVTMYDNDDGCYRSCDAGSWASSYNSSFDCISCSPGYYCAGGCDDPSACPVGTSLATYGSSDLGDCEGCPGGYYALEEASASCSTCPAGYFCESAAAAPEACPSGLFASTGAVECSECADGYYNDLTAQEFCQLCPAGHECSDKNTEPSECSPGSYSYGNATFCESCPEGYYCSSAGSSPEICPAGSYSLSNWAYCVICPAGGYCFNTYEVPTLCDAGSASLGGSTYCTTCASGTYSSLEGSAECTNCPAGSSCLNVSSAPELCTNGTYSQLGSAICSTCDAGTYSFEGATSCLACPVGHSCFDPVSSPTLCDEGYYSDGGQVFSCSSCDPGTYTDDLHDRCISCTQGYDCSDPTSGETLCEAGYYSTTGASACTECSAGSFCASPFSLPQACSPGTYSTSGSANCTMCPSGYYCTTPSALPIACSDGFYSSEGESTCIPCPPGSYCVGAPRDEASKSSCPAGTYSLGEASYCSECPKGYYCPDSAQSPEACPNGYYADIGNMTACDRCTAGNFCPSSAMPEQACPNGYYSSDTATECTGCPPGSYCANAAASPVTCPPGTFSLALATNCTSCPPGYYCPNIDSADFYECPDGTYSVGDASSCDACPAGYYCPLTTVALEIACPGGYFSGGGASNCTACTPGFTCLSDGSNMVACEPGYYSQAGSAICTPCPAGYYCPNTASDTVWECPAGSYSEGILQSCVACQAGYYCPYLDSAEALPCLSGSFSVGGKDVCTECPAGFACSSTQTAQTTPCIEGYYSLLGAPLCTACPEGYRCPDAASAPVACDIGYYSVAAAVNCTSCPAGYFCDNPEAIPQPCEVGYYSGGGSSLCLACQPGYRCPEASTSATPVGSECPPGTYCNPARTLTECPAGMYGNVSAGTSLDEGCQSCTEGYYCTDTGNTLQTRKICPAGYYCPIGSSSPTGCAAGLYNELTGSWSNNDCSECDAGYYCTAGSDSSTSAVCPAGNFCPANTPSATHYPCPAGTYSATTGLVDKSGCKNCTVGAYCPEGSTAPTSCLAGTYQPAGSATDVSACLSCEPGWACPSAGMWEMTTLCGTGNYCPAGTSYRDQYACDAGTYTDSTNLTSANQCSPCPERKACLSGATSVDWAYCGSGYYCPEGTPSRTSYPCPAGSYTNRTDLAAASECYPCPLGLWCGGSGSDEPDGECEAGYYCPLSTAAATDYPCPAGTFSNSTSLYLESQCKDCPPGYYCPEASTTIEPCPAGTYSPFNATEDDGPASYPSCSTCPAGSYCVEASIEPVPCGKGLYSDEGADDCSVCEAGYYCGSNETTATNMYTGGGSWDLSSDDAGMCFNGTYCAEGMDRAPDLLRDSCPAAYYCPAGTTSPLACPSGTYNHHEGMDDEDEDCIISLAGYYAIEASTNMTGPCAAGYYCPAGSTGPQQVPCPERYYRASEGATSQDDCALCVSGGYCLSGSTDPAECPRGFYCVTGVMEPEPCPLGTYGNTSGLRQISDCSACDPGNYCDQRGLTSPAGLCDPGYYCLEGSYTSAPSAPGSPLTIDDTTIGGLCPAGGYCPIGSSSQQPCPAGTYNNFSGAADEADCSSCPPGFYCSGTSNPAPTGSCLSGYYCTGGASSNTQYQVEDGYYSDAGASQQYPCLPGTYQPEVGQESCLDCRPGYYCMDTASITITYCPAGRYCPQGSDVPKLCPAGTYSPTLALQNVTQCTPCDPGKYCVTNGLTEISGSCEAGHYCPSGGEIASPIGQPYGDICSPGHYCEESSAWPEPCPVGTYYGAEGNDGDVWYNDTITGIPFRSYCSLCPATYACNDTGLTAPDTLCAKGYFCKLGASSPVPYCQGGEGACDYGVCPEGHYCPTGTADPIGCPPGTYMNNTGTAECFECPERFYCDGSLPQGYEECPIGHYCPTGTDASLPNCPAGTFSAQAALATADECTDCTSGQYCAATGLTEPDGVCAAGFYCPSGSQDSNGKTSTETEHHCSPGGFCIAGVGYPTLCPVRTYNPSEGISAEEDCVACSSGSYCETAGLLGPTGPCAGGYYCKRGVDGAAPTSGLYLENGLTYGGDLCPVGTYCPNGTDTPLPCDAGTYNDLRGQDECFSCPPGFYCEANATEYESNPCPAGHYCLEGTRYENEYPCPAGTYANETKTSSLEQCVDAPAGSYVAGSGSTTVTGRCDQGFYCTGASSSATPFCVDTVNDGCETGGPCVAGEYCPAGSSYPEACPGGNYCAGTSGAITGQCFAGYYCTQGSSTNAPEAATNANGVIGDICTAGHYCEKGSVDPRACPPGTYSPATGNTNSSACLLCEPGFMCPNASTAIPTEPCPAGYYCPAGTTEAVLQCGTGQACVENSWEPAACDAGTYQMSTGMAFCDLCPEGSYCLSGAEVPTDCPAGSYCPTGTLWDTQYQCPSGTYSNATNLVDSSECSPCSAGSYCFEVGLAEPTGPCDEGYYCNGGSSVAGPDGMSSESYVGDTCVDRSNATANDLCPPGHYCPSGSSAPVPCPPGTSSPAFGLQTLSDCPDCEAGFYCPDNAAYNSTVECTEGYYCPGGDAYPTRLCPAGHYCPAGSASPVDCFAGTYQNDTGASSCDICPHRYYCLATSTEPITCPAGSYCPEGTEFESEFSCPNGTFSNETGLAAASECSLCSPGSFCGSEGLNSPEGLCGSGFYCGLGSSSPVPGTGSDSSVGGLCAAGYVCVKGAASPQPVDGITGYECPRGSYCPAGSAYPIGCPPGTYNPSEAMGECAECLAGSVCPGNSTTPEECPLYHYCPAASASGILCPGGTYGARNDLEAESECAPCPAGYYCLDGDITDTCRAGYFCKTGIDNPTPNSVYANYTYDVYNDIWEALDAGPCPAGHYCPAGAEDPQPCLNASVRDSLLGVSAEDCGQCRGGYVCYPGDPIPQQCYRGYYCPVGEDPIACSPGTYNPELLQDDQDDCVACPEGSYCYVEGIGDYGQYPCPVGHYCLTREDNPVSCPGGTYRNDTGAGSVHECHLCPAGFQCGTETITPEVCPETTYCPTGASNTTTCPAGHYCPVQTGEPIICPQGYYCPLASPEPVTCVLGTFCPEGAEIFTSCPLGWYGSLSSNNTLWSQGGACAECPPGTYGADPQRLVCDICPSGYVCLGTTRTATPISIEDDGGYECPAGHYCPAGSSQEVACLAGSYNSQTGSSAAAECLVCEIDHYQDQDGSASCLPCSSSSTSTANSTECKCLGLNRAFQLSDGQCICRSGYEYYNEGGELVSTVDGAVDCQPIVYERCYTGEALDADGDCLSESDCNTKCGDVGGTFYEHIGLCECYGMQDLNAVCDVDCRDSAAVMFVDSTSGLIVIVGSNGTEYVDPSDLPSFAGALYCTGEVGCSLFPVSVSTNFSGVYGTGNAVAAASGSSVPSTRRRRLSSAFQEHMRSQVNDKTPKDTGSNVTIDTGQALPDRVDMGGVMMSTAGASHRHTGSHWKVGRGFDLSLEGDMIQRLLRRRAEKYRPRNQYRDRFLNADGDMIRIPGAIPVSQRLAPLPNSYGSLTVEDDVDITLSWEREASAVRKKSSKRALVEDSPVEPAVDHPLSCVSQGDSVLFDISSGCYPVYEKDSLLNSNPEFDYGEFRTMAELSTSSATYSTFGFVFESVGTYVFSSSCNPLSIFVLAVMAEDVSCTTDAHFVPLTAANLIKLGVAKNSDDITLTPDWALIGGLLAGVAFMILGVVSAVYYFRTKAWATGKAPIPKYRDQARTDHLEATDENSQQKQGFFARRPNKITPISANGDGGGTGSPRSRSRWSVSGRGNSVSPRARSRWSVSGRGRAGNDPNDPEMQAGLLSSSPRDDPSVDELVDRMQRYHDVIAKEFSGQKELVIKLHHLLEQEADELKRLLGARAGAAGGLPFGVDENATKATLARLKTDLASRRLHEAGVSTSEVEALSALKRLQELLKEGAQPFAARVMLEIASPDVAEQARADDSRAATSLLREIQEAAELIKAEVVDELACSLDHERRRQHAARTMLEGAVSAGGVVLHEDIAQTLKTMGEMDARTDAAERGVASGLRRLADRLPACTQELLSSEGLIMRNLARIRAMGNASLEGVERQRGEGVIAGILEQLIRALGVVIDKAEKDKAAVDAARIDAEVERAHLEGKVNENIDTLARGTKAIDGDVPATPDDLQGMLKEIRTLVSSSGTPAAVMAPTTAASALFSQIAATEYRRHSVGFEDEAIVFDDGGAGGAGRAQEEAEEAAARKSKIEADLLSEQEAGVATVVAVAETAKKSLANELLQTGATDEEKEAMMRALEEDQRAIEGVLEGERLRIEESLRAAAVARKAREERHAEEDATDEGQTKVELLHQQSEQIKEMRRKHEAAQLAVGAGAAGDSSTIARAFEEEEDVEDIQEDSDEAEDGATDADIVVSMRKAHVQQNAMLEASLSAKARSARNVLGERIRAQRAKREAELVEKGLSPSVAAIQAETDLAKEEASQKEQLMAELVQGRKLVLRAEAVAQRQARRDVRTIKDPAEASAAAERDLHRVHQEAVEDAKSIQDVMTEEGKARRAALVERLRARRHAKEVELSKRGAGEEEMSEQGEDLTRLESLAIEALEEDIRAEREAAMGDVRTHAAAAELAAEAAVAVSSTANTHDPEIDQVRTITSSKMKDLHLAAMEKLEHDLSTKEKVASRALRDRLRGARAGREATLKETEGLSSSDAARKARRELEDSEESAQTALIEELNAVRLKAVDRANAEAEASATAATAARGLSMKDEADRLLAEHRNRTKELREAMQADAKRQHAHLRERLASRRKATDCIVAIAKSVSPAAAAHAAALADAAEKEEVDALDRDLADEETRFESDAEGYEQNLQDIVVAAQAAVVSATSAAKAKDSGAGATSFMAVAAAAAVAAAVEAETVAAAQAKREALRQLHERNIAAMEIQDGEKRRAMVARLAQRRAAAGAARREAMQAAGASEDETAKSMAEENVRAAKETKEQNDALEKEAMVKMEEERALQRLAVADDVDPEKEAARIREKHTQGMAALEKDFEKYRREQRAALSNRLRKRRAAKEEALRNAGATKAETASAWKSLDFDDERDAIQLEDTLRSLEDTEIKNTKQAFRVAAGKGGAPESELADLRAKHQEGEVRLKEFLRAGAGARRARLNQRVAARAAERVRELKAQGRSAGYIKKEEDAILAAGRNEEKQVEAVLATETQARIVAARRTARATEASLEARESDARKLRKRHERAHAELSAEMIEKKRRIKEAVEARLEARKTKRAAELKAAKATKKVVANEMSRLDREAKEEVRRGEEEVNKEAALAMQAQRIKFAKEEAEVRAAQLMADKSKRAGEAEVQRIRREHETQQRKLEDVQEKRRKDRQKALAIKLAKRKQDRINAAISAAESPESRQKLEAELDLEEIAAVAALEEELLKDMCAELEENGRKQARAEAAAQSSAQAAIEAAENRGRNTREEHEQSTRELDEQIAKAKVTQSAKLQDRLAKKRNDREEQLKRENASAEAVKEAHKQLKEEEAREVMKLENHLDGERKRLHDESTARAKARRTKEEAEARDSAVAAAAAADTAKREADECVRRLQEQHREQHAALEHQMMDEQQSREGKLRDRLAKKRKAKEEEMFKAALSEREKQSEEKRLEDEEKAERQRFYNEVEEENANRIEAQQRVQKEALATAAAEAARAAEVAAATMAAAAAADAAREAMDAAEQDEFKRRAQRLKDESEISAEKQRRALAGESAKTKSKLTDRLAKKKQETEKRRRELEAAQKTEEERLLAKHKEEAEAAKAAAAPGWSGDIAWDEAVAVAMAEPPRGDESQSLREARVLKSVLEADIVPENKIGKCVELVMAGRHDKETSDLLTAQYKARASRLATSLGALLAEKNKARTEALQRLAKANAGPEEKAAAAAGVEDEFAGRQQELETGVIQEMEPIHLEEQLGLRQRQLREVANTVKSIAPESALKRLQEIASSRQEEELENYRALMEREKEERLKRVQEERARFEQDLRERHEAEMQRLQAEEDKVMEIEREAQEARMQEKQAELERQRAEEQKKMEERSDELDAKDKEELLEQFKRDQAAELGALKAKEASQKSKLEQKLAARRQKKTEELKKREEKELKAKEAREAQVLQAFEKQTQLAAKAEAVASSASERQGRKAGSVEGLDIDIDQTAIQLAREAGGSNDAKERLKQNLAVSETRRRMHRHGSISTIGGGARSSLSAGANGAAAAAAAAATAATATAYTHISTKLEGIEALISALKAAQGEKRFPGSDAAGSAEVYQDAEDAATIPEGNVVQVVARDKLPVQSFTRLQFGEHLLSVLGLEGRVTLQVAKKLPPAMTSGSDGGGGRGAAGGTNANAFRNSYLWNPNEGVLYIHVRRLSSSGDFGLVLVHAAAHIQVDPLDVSNDLDPRFTQHFHRALKILTQEIFKYRGAKAPATDGDIGSQSDPLSTSVQSSQALPNVIGLGPSSAVNDLDQEQATTGRSGIGARGGGVEFAQGALAERMERYARASGHPRLLELLSRHSMEMKDKFTLSDDEDQVSNAGDVDYMGNFDTRDGDSIFRSPAGSIKSGGGMTSPLSTARAGRSEEQKGDQETDEKKEEKGEKVQDRINKSMDKAAATKVISSWTKK